jgi:carbonic anhydrase
MSKGFEDLLGANEQYAAEFDRGHLAAPPARGLAVVTCMDSRIEPLQALGLSLGDAKVIRNAGGRVTEDALRSLVVATHLLGVHRVLVLEHTDCGMTKLGEQEARERVGAPDLQLGMIADQRASLEEDVQRVRSSPHLPQDLAVVGGLYDVLSGRVEIVVPSED